MQINRPTLPPLLHPPGEWPDKIKGASLKREKNSALSEFVPHVPGACDEFEVKFVS